MRVAIAGFGDVGARLGHRLAARGASVLALRRSPVLPAAGIDQRAIDLTTLRSGQLAKWRADTLVCLAAPDHRDAAAYDALFIDAARRTVDALGGSLQRVLFTSSTAVYGQQQSGRIDDCVAAVPDSWNGERLLAAEQALRAHAPALSVLRPSGLYGPGREWLLRRAQAGEVGQARWTSRIHVEDAAAAIDHLLRLAEPADVYCLSDPTPVSEARALQWLRRLLAGAPIEEFELAVEESAVGGRWIDSRRLRDCGYEFFYPDLLAGYRAVIQAGAGLAV